TLEYLTQSADRFRNLHQRCLQGPLSKAVSPAKRPPETCRTPHVRPHPASRGIRAQSSVRTISRSGTSQWVEEALVPRTWGGARPCWLPTRSAASLQAAAAWICCGVTLTRTCCGHVSIRPPWGAQPTTG